MDSKSKEYKEQLFISRKVAEEYNRHIENCIPFETDLKDGFGNEIRNVWDGWSVHFKNGAHIILDVFNASVESGGPHIGALLFTENGCFDGKELDKIKNCWYTIDDGKNWYTININLE